MIETDPTHPWPMSPDHPTPLDFSAPPGATDEDPDTEHNERDA